MQADFWHAMWESGVVGFQQTEINGYLQQHWQRLGLQGDETVLVPLCGKSLDMLWLGEQGHKVLGVELSQKALDEFLDENKLRSVAPLVHAHFCGYRLSAMTLLCGDFFHLSAADCEEVGAVYDRAAIVALPPEMRKQYAAHLQAILPAGTKLLLVNLEYDQSLLNGPPFSVPESEICTLFADCARIDVVAQQSLQRKGVAAQEKVFLIEF
ncbi:thiopurine S-methyltransferase [Thiomicrorhabdus cannonii]|uniref:thiopurine S-methyltransferase n=1 Tax=Thiomicrorhabdus cannonii TaxID=2748011 RepID=UPI0015BC5E8C|nr:thiopurine S-methyltransferase [Thiomicrorhabdus cannonii]